MFSALGEHLACHTQAEERTCWNRQTTTSPLGRLPEHPPTAGAAAEAEVLGGLFWNDEDGMVADSWDCDDDNEAEFAAAAPASLPAGLDVLMAVPAEPVAKPDVSIARKFVALWCVSGRGPK